MSDGAGFDTFHSPATQSPGFTPPGVTPPVVVSKAAHSSSTADTFVSANPDSRPIEERILDRIEAAQKAVHDEITFDQDVRPTRLQKVIIQIPCLNEEETLGVTLAELPRDLDGVAKVEWMIIDDGSTDRTAAVARELGVDHVVRLPRNQGLARAFMAGITEAIRLDADIIVNTDADNQYQAADIQKLIDPIVQGRSEFVIGARPINETPHFSRAKKMLQWLGSWVVRKVSKTDIPDAPSGFRAMSRSTAMQLNVFSDYTYTLETIIQAGQKNMAITSVPIRTNPDLRPSRLLRSIPSYVSRSASTIVRIFVTYRPFQFFAIPGMVCCAASLVLCLRYLAFWAVGSGGGHVQSLILGAMLMGIGVTGIVVGLVCDLISVNRKLLEKVDWHVRQLEDSLRDRNTTDNKRDQ